MSLTESCTRRTSELSRCAQVFLLSFLFCRALNKQFSISNVALQSFLSNFFAKQLQQRTTRALFTTMLRPYVLLLPSKLSLGDVEFRSLRRDSQQNEHIRKPQVSLQEWCESNKSKWQLPPLAVMDDDTGLVESNSELGVVAEGTGYVPNQSVHRSAYRVDFICIGILLIVLMLFVIVSFVLAFLYFDCCRSQQSC